LGEGEFGILVLTKGKLPGGQVYAMKSLTKQSISSSSISDIMAVKP